MLERRIPMKGRGRYAALAGAILLGALLVPAAQAWAPKVILAEDFGYPT